MKYVLLCIAIFVSACSLTALPEDGPQIEIVGGKVYDWGVVAPPKEGALEAEIKIKNIGTGVLKLTEIRPGCGCTKTDPDKTELGAGEVSTMKVKLNVSPQQSGVLAKSITVRSNSLTDSVLSITLRADIKRSLSFEPANYFALASTAVGVETHAEVRIINKGEQPIELKNFVVPDGMKLNAEKTVTIAPGSTFELKLVTTPSAEGQINGAVQFETTDKDTPSVTLSVFGTATKS
jgi:hypothetical protein